MRTELRLSGLVNLDYVAECLRIALCEESLDADGFLIKNGASARILINNGIGYETRKRFTLAHEFGHFYMPHHEAEIFRCLGRDIQSYRSNKTLESEANEFAAELLLPTAELEKLLMHPPTMMLVQEFSEAYGISLTATAVKIAEITCERMAVVLSADGAIKWVSKSSSFPYWINKGPLHEWTYAYDYFKDGCLEGGAKIVRACAWCETSLKELDLIEESVAFERLGMVLTLLHIPVKEDEEDFEY